MAPLADRSREMLGQKIDVKTSLWLFTCLVTGLFFAPMIVGGASRDWSSRLTVALTVTLAASILGVVVKSQPFALCCSAFLTWPALGYALLMFLLRGMSNEGAVSQTAVPVVNIVTFAATMMLLAMPVTFAVLKFSAPKASAASDLAARVKLEA